MQNSAVTPLKGFHPPTPADATRDGQTHALACLTVPDQKRFRAFGWGPRQAPRHPTIAAAIRHQMRCNPTEIAVECAGHRLSYAALDAASNRLAGVLRAHGVRRGDAVCLFLYRSIDMVVAIVAALKLGAAYVPQHVGVAPTETLRHVADVTGAKVVLSLSELADQVPVAPHQTLIAIDTVIYDPMLDAPGPDGADYEARPDDLAMILFTSGTTGVPNGVQVTHANLANILLTAPGNLGMRPGCGSGRSCPSPLTWPCGRHWARCPTGQRWSFAASPFRKRRNRSMC